MSGQYLPQPHGGICDEGPGEKAGREAEFTIESCATSSEELGNPVYPPAQRKLAEHNISCKGKHARQLTIKDYDAFDMLICMDDSNMRGMLRICGGDPAGKMSRLMDHTNRPGSVADPWYTGNFEETWRDVLEGCTALLQKL